MSETNERVMACPDCGLTVSKRANTCPHCGAPLAEYRKEGKGSPEEKKPEEKHQANWFGVFIGIVLVLMGIITMVMRVSSK